MRASYKDKSLLTRPAFVAAIGVLAIGAWGFHFRQQLSVARVREQIDAGRQLAAQGQLMAAQKEWYEVIQGDPQNVEAWLLLSESFLNSKQWRPALEALRKIEKTDPATPNIYARMALCALGIGDLPTAHRQAHIELARDPNHIEALQALVTVAERRHEDDKRLELLRRLIQLEPDNTVYLSLLADALVVKTQYEEARPLLARLLQLKPNAKNYVNHGMALLVGDGSTSDLKQAAQNFEKALQLNAGDMQPRLYLAQVYLRLRQPRQAIPHLEALIQSPLSESTPLFELANAYQQLGDRAKSSQLRRRYAQLRREEYEISVLRSRLEHDRKNFDRNLQLGLILLQSRHPVNAATYLKTAAALRPGEARAKAALKRLEDLYVFHLNALLQGLKRRNSRTVDYHLAYVNMLRLHDRRTQNVRRQVAAAALPPPFPVAPTAPLPTVSTPTR
ncbi:MAG: protein O-GlcNAc transferase [Abditibacteriota bacterium]|nr:protein O-GlcNAc transferase [Abditibacteriota bacterium]